MELVKFVNLCGATRGRQNLIMVRIPQTSYVLKNTWSAFNRRYDQIGYQDLMIDVEPLENLHAILQKMI